MMCLAVQALLDKGKGSRNQILCLIAGEERHCLGDGSDFHLTSLCTFFILSIHILALFLKVCKKFSVCFKGVACLLQGLLGHCVFFISICKLPRLGVDLGLASCDLFSFAFLNIFIFPLALHFLLLGLGKVRFEILFHLFKQTENLGRWSAYLQQGGALQARIESTFRSFEEG